MLTADLSATNNSSNMPQQFSQPQIYFQAFQRILRREAANLAGIVVHRVENGVLLFHRQRVPLGDLAVQYFEK